MGQVYFGANIYVGYRKLPQGEGSWIARRRNDDGKQEYYKLDDCTHYDDAVTATLEWASAVKSGVVSKGTTVKEAW